ncbi:MAG: dTDP-4-dehydrorhamnose 3,5-epimerase [Verrucomicrobia bacterium]|jgi:dTDP-4-dehydrorhamnose 3,5-epimerase|nr:dTDP-4-dehydrorhamnose 3,5-epimerase [Verrucomicrobiota bacterium]MBT7066316.1 dTDP-4-dehydrorhamnose 3,5-epimerase [Verrucomicrobiota bacterium]MBT7699274.1 dTDP-4-dehydrorhamnose 3,5-epimerase [Verrucomicrobiota bacterium]
MKIEAADLPGVMRIGLEPSVDERGYFARTFDRDALAAAGLTTDYPEHSISFNRAAGTLRGMHWQVAPHGESKIVRCTRGRVYDVAVDIRPDSPTYRRWVGEELSAINGEALYIPHGFAHGFLTLEPESELLYYISHPYVPEAVRGFRYDDVDVEIAWPAQPAVISARDLALPTLDAAPGAEEAS